MVKFGAVARPRGSAPARFGRTSRDGGEEIFPMAPTDQTAENSKIHPLAHVATREIGDRCLIEQFCVIRSTAILDEAVHLAPHCFIDERVRLGRGTTVQAGVHFGEDAEISSGVSVGENSVICQGVRLYENVSVGAGVTVSPGVEVGQHATIEDGSVVHRDVPPGARVRGNPGTIQGYETEEAIIPLPHPSASKIQDVKQISLVQVKDLRGTLTVCQWDKQLPFSPQRVFFQHGVPSEKIRGAHAHKECAQVLVCVSGRVNVLLDDGLVREEHLLDSGDQGLLIPPGIWATQYNYSQEAVTAVFASHNYDAADYIRDYDEYLAYRRISLDSAA